MTTEMTKSELKTVTAQAKVKWSESTHTQIHEINYECVCRIETEKPLFATNVQINQSTKWEWEQRGANDDIATAATGFFSLASIFKGTIKKYFQCSTLAYSTETIERQKIESRMNYEKYNPS